MAKPKILVFAGSTRTDSYNKKLARVAAEALKKVGAEVTYLDLRDIPLPLYDGDLEKKEFPENAKKLKQIFLNHQGLLISSPEYNSSIPGVLKNAIDWVSRPEKPDEESLACFKGKVAGLVSASPGGLGGLRGLVTLRSILGNIDVLVIPNQLAVPRAHEAFNPDGSLKDPKQQTAVEKIAVELTRIITKLST